MAGEVVPDSTTVEILGRQRSDPERVDLYTRWSMYSTFIVFPILGLTLFGQSVAEPEDLAAVPFAASVLFLAGLLLQCGLGLPVVSKAMSQRLGGPPIPRALLVAFLAVTGVVACAALLMPGGEAIAGRAGATALVLAVGLLVVAPLLAWRTIGILVVTVAVAAALSLRLEISALGVTAGESARPVAVAISLCFAVGALALSTRFSVWVLAVVWELDRTRAVHARLAVAEERLRFSRDLHDVVGRALSAIAVKSELGAELVRRGEAGGHAERGAAEMAEVRDLAQETLREVRGVVAGYRAADLAAEFEGARSVLRSAGVEVEVRGSETGLELARPVQEALAWVVREAVTNVVRHAAARTCEIALETAHPGAVRLMVGNDGVGKSPRGQGGSGLDGLRERLAPLGGELETVLEGDRHILTAVLALQVAPRGERDQPPATTVEREP